MSANNSWYGRVGKALAALLLAGGLLTWWTVSQTNRTMHEDLRRQVQMVAQGLDRDAVAELTGTDADLGAPSYLRVKEQLAAARSSSPRCRFLYLMSRRPDGTVFFLVDSEPAASKDCSPPGQVYSEASKACLRAFSNQSSVLDGPTADRWGVWVSGFVPIFAPLTAGSSSSLGGSRELMAVLGMDIDARTWRGLLVRSAWPPVALTLVLAAILLLGSALLAWRSQILGIPPRWMRHLEASLTAVVGMILTLFTAWLVCGRMADERKQAFEQLAANQTEAVAETLHFLRDTELASLERFFESSENVTAEEFRYFTAYLAKNPSVQAWEWVPFVQAGGKSRFEADARAVGAMVGRIWQLGAQGKREPASGREGYYPVFQAAPLAGNEWVRGYDLGSNPLCRAMLEDAVRTGRPSASDPTTLGKDPGRVMLISRPVFSNGEPKRVRGFVLAVLRMGSLLHSDAQDKAVLQELSILRTDGTSESLATSWGAGSPPSTGLSARRLIFAFGRVFSLNAYAGTKAFSASPMREWALTFLGGMVLTGLLSVGTSMFLGRREEVKRLVAERELLAKAIAQATEAIFITDAKARIQYVNPAFVSLTGYSREDVIGKTPRILKSGKHEIAFYREMWKTLLSGKAWQGNLVNKKKDGTLFTEESTISPILDSSNQIVSFVAVKRDITQELIIQTQLNQAQKMESVGRLAGGVAHDFNNMLCVILGHTEMALADVGPSHPLFGDLEAIRSSAKRSADLTRQLLAFSRQQPISPKVIDLNENIAGMLNMLSPLIGEDIRIDSQLDNALWLVKMDPSQIDQIMVNLCVNARDAISGGGTITIEASNRMLDADFCASQADAVPGAYVQISVSDTGCGIDKVTQAHIFEPFFTTKAIGKGTGLGLATVYGIAKQNGGFINVYSELGQGSSFRVYLPRHVGESELPQRVEEPPQRGNETILLVEDEPAIMNMTKMILERLGYSVLAAGSPDEAVALAKADPGRINLLITDVIMPEMNGRELAKKLRAHIPHLKCLFMSGYTANVISPHGILEPGVCFIQKPFSMGNLAAKIREALDSQPE